jgi:hypothetical protein
MVRPIKSNCCSRLRTRTETTTTLKRPGNQFTGDKESKLTTIKPHMKNGKHQRDAAAIESQL